MANKDVSFLSFVVINSFSSLVLTSGLHQEDFLQLIVSLFFLGNPCGSIKIQWRSWIVELKNPEGIGCVRDYFDLVVAIRNLIMLKVIKRNKILNGIHFSLLQWSAIGPIFLFMYASIRKIKSSISSIVNMGSWT